MEFSAGFKFGLGPLAISRIVRACKIWLTGGILKAFEDTQRVSFSTSFSPPLLIRLALLSLALEL